MLGNKKEKKCTVSLFYSFFNPFLVRDLEAEVSHAERKKKEK